MFVVGAYVLAWLAFAIPILAAHGAFAPPVPDAAFLTLATLGIGLAASAWRPPGPAGRGCARC
jgi:hypothetical protein